MNIEKQIEEQLEKIGYNQCRIDMLKHISENFGSLKNLTPLALLCEINKIILELTKK